MSGGVFKASATWSAFFPDLARPSVEGISRVLRRKLYTSRCALERDTIGKDLIQVCDTPGYMPLETTGALRNS